MSNKRKQPEPEENVNEVLTPSDTGAGNTKTAPKPHKNWTFTWNNYPDTFDTDIQGYLGGAAKYAYQEEIGEQKTPHIQGCVSWTNARHFNALKKLNEKIHWEVMKAEFKQNVTYCTKLETRKPGGIIRTKGIPKPIEDPIKQLRPWQATIEEELKQAPENRIINWIQDELGGTGKTTYCKHLCITQKAIYVSGKASDVKYAVKCKLDEGEEVRIVLWDVPRTVEKYLSYEAIESVKNGIFFCNKYESGQCIFESPHIYIFANFEPETTKLSLDRWNIRKINPNNMELSKS